RRLPDAEGHKLFTPSCHTVAQVARGRSCGGTKERLNLVQVEEEDLISRAADASLHETTSDLYGCTPRAEEELHGVVLWCLSQGHIRCYPPREPAQQWPLPAGGRGHSRGNPGRALFAQAAQTLCDALVRRGHQPRADQFQYHGRVVHPPGDAEFEFLRRPVAVAGKEVV